MTSALSRMLASWDEAALVALASKGLLRRASKDVAAGQVALTDRTADRARLEVDGQAVNVTADGPQAAGCSCPATGTCWHILAAVLWLQQEPDGPAAEAPDGVDD